MALGIFEIDTLRDVSGNAVVLDGATFEVRDESSGALAAIYEDVDGESAMENPYTLESGESTIRFYVDQGIRFRVVVEQGEYERTLRYRAAESVGVELGTEPGQVPTNADLPDFGTAAEADIGTEPTQVPSNSNLRLTSNLTVTIPGDYATLQAAIDELSQRYIVKQGVTITLMIETGHELTHGLLVQNGDYSHFVISSVDSTVSLSESFTGVNESSISFSASLGDVIAANYAKLPVINVLIDCGEENGTGLVLANKSIGYVRTGKGVINAGAYGLHVSRGSGLQAGSTNFSGSGWGSRVTTGGFLTAPQANFSGARENEYLGGGQTAALDVSRGSIVNIMGAPGGLTNLSNSAGWGLAVRRSRVSATYCNVSGANGYGISAVECSQIAATGSVANECDRGFSAAGASTLDARLTTANDCDSYAYLATGGSTINASLSEGLRAGTNGARALEGSTINLNGSNVQMGESPATSDIQVDSGSIISAHGATGGTFITVNTIAARGIIFRDE